MSESKISEDVRSMAKLISENIEIDKTGAGSEKEPIYEKTLPSDLTIETVKKVSDHNTNFVAAGALAFGEQSLKAMEKHDKVEETNLKLSMVGRDHVEYNMQRHREFSSLNPVYEPGE